MEYNIGWKLKRLNDEMLKNANNQLQEHNLTFSQLRVLIYLLTETETQSASLKSLEKHFTVAQATMAGLVSRMEAKGIVSCYGDPEDRRIKMVKLTEAGKGLLEEHRKEMEERDLHILDGLTEQERGNLEYYLDVLYKNVSGKGKETGE